NTTAATTADITAAALTLSTSNVSKTYDGGLSASGAAVVTGGTLFGSVTLSDGSFAFTDKNAGTGKHVTVAGVTVNDGNDGKNYAVTYATNTASTITALGVTVDAAGTNRVYDGGTADAVSLTSSGILAGDRVAFSGTGAFGDKHVGTDKTVSVSGITARGSDAGNYSFNTTATTTADITALGITVDATGTDRVYDGGIADAVTLASAGVLSGDTVNFSGTGSFADKHAGAAKAVSVSGIAANGADAGNYSFNTTADTTADISRLGITVDATARDRVYDATTNATVALGSGGILVGDVVNFTGTGSFADKNAGTDKTVAINGIAANGADAGNYSFNTTAGTTATITLATLTYLADPALVQRGQTPDSLGGTVTGLVGGESLDEATDGTLAWQTPATAASPAGAYAIDGNGLSALNYVVVQAPGNATALQVIDGAAPDSVGIPGLVVSTVAGLQQSDDSDKPHAPNAPDVHIVDGGVRLP
ncbi:MAG TPA: YDG domain-containing protein, partial [Mycobacterium sp.]|nr:YDG domain-containing protein [Mycobacterium sp.]